MGFDTAAARAALRVFRGNVQLAAQTLAHNAGSLPADLQLAVEDAPSTPSTSPSDSAGRAAASTAARRGRGPRGAPWVLPSAPLSPLPSLAPSCAALAGTSSASTDEDMETEAVNEILEDIPEHEEDYLDSTLEDEEIIIAEYLSYVENIKSASKKN